MRRAWLVILSASFVAAVGCGRPSYEKRLETTLEQLKYARRLSQNLMPAANEKKFADLAIYLRAPKEEAIAKTGQLPVNEGQFDLDASFNDKNDATLHVLARVKMPKKAKVKGAPPVAAAPLHGDFINDVLGVLSSVFNSAEGLQTPKFVDESKKGNRFRRLIFQANDKEVKLYTFKQENHEVALVFVYDPKLKGPISSKIDLCLESFATGAKATRLLSGGKAEEEASDAPPPGPL